MEFFKIGKRDFTFIREMRVNGPWQCILYMKHVNLIAECQYVNSLDGNVCNVTTGQCGLCIPGFTGHFCTGKYEFLILEVFSIQM